MVDFAVNELWNVKEEGLFICLVILITVAVTILVTQQNYRFK